jgi:hypothetical protein
VNKHLLCLCVSFCIRQFPGIFIDWEIFERGISMKLNCFVTITGIGSYEPAITYFFACKNEAIAFAEKAKIRFKNSCVEVCER